MIALQSNPGWANPNKIRGILGTQKTRKPRQKSSFERMEGLLHIGPVLVRPPCCGATTQGHGFFVLTDLGISDGSTIDRIRGPVQLLFLFL